MLVLPCWRPPAARATRATTRPTAPPASTTITWWHNSNTERRQGLLRAGRGQGLRGRQPRRDRRGQRDAARGHAHQARRGVPERRRPRRLHGARWRRARRPRRGGPDQGHLRGGRGRRSRRSAAPSPAGRSTARPTRCRSRVGVVGFWYNKALFEQAGITEPADHDGRVLRRRRQAQGRRHRAGLRRRRRQVAGRALLVLHRAARVLAGRPRRTRCTSLDFSDPCFVKAGEDLEDAHRRPSRSTRASCPPRPRRARPAPPVCWPPARSPWRCRATGSPASCRASPRTARVSARTPAGSRSRPSTAARATRRPRSVAVTPGPSPRRRPTPRSTSSKYLLSDEVQKGFAEHDMGLPTNPTASRLGLGPGPGRAAQGP